MENGTATLSPTQRFWRLLSSDKREVKNVYIYAVFSGLVNLSLPLGIQAIIGLIQGGRISASWVLLVTIVIAGVAITGILQIFQLKLTEQLQLKIFTRAAFEFVYRIPRIRLEALYKSYAPELMNRFFDTLTVQKGLSKILIDFSRATLQVIFGLLLLSFYHPFFILFSLLLVVYIYIMYRITAKRGLDSSLKESKYKYQVAHWLEEVARTNTIFRLSTHGQLALNRTDELASKYLEARGSHFRVLVQQYSMLVVFKVLVATGLLAIGGILVMEQQMNIGQFVAAEIIILLIMNSVEKLIVSTETIYDVLTALEKIGQVTDMPLEDLEVLNPIDLEHRALEVGLEEVEFSYPGGDRPVLDKLDICIPAGQHWAVLNSYNNEGEALLQLIAGLYLPQAGKITLNGRPRSSYKPENLKERIGYLTANDQLFFGSLIENISVGREYVSKDEVVKIVEALGLKPLISQLPSGYDTLLHTGEQFLTPSVRQRILLARCLVGGPSLVLLYHPFVGLSPRERQRIADFLVRKEHNWTVLAVTEEDLYLKETETILALKNGKLYASGTYDSLKSLIHADSDYHA